MTDKKAIEVLLRIKKGAEDCIEFDKRFQGRNADIEEWKNEIDAIETMINGYKKEKARADKLEKDYSKALTRIDELESKLL